MLTFEDMEKILVDVMLKRAPRLVTDEALDFREKMMNETAAIRARGYQVEIPFN